MITDQKDFLEKYRISDREFKKTGYSWEGLMAIAGDYELRRDKLRFSDICDMYAMTISKFTGVYSVRSRIKDPEHLVEKIIRKKRQDENIVTITLENYPVQIKDLIGIRALHLYKHDCIPLHEQIYTNYGRMMRSTPVVNLRLGDNEAIFKNLQNIEIRKERNYRSIHYILMHELNNGNKEKFVYMELQTRTMFEESWSELDHSMRYPYYMEDMDLKYFTNILNRLTGTCDELAEFMNLYYKRLEKRLAHRSVREGGRAESPIDFEAMMDFLRNFIKEDK